MLRRLGPLLLPLFLVPVACASPEEEEAEEGGEAAFTAEDAACFEAPSKSGESRTEARARCLTEQASRMLDAQIARNEDPRDKGLASFRGKLRVPAETGCFTEDVNGSWTGLVQNDIDSERDVGMISVQLKAAVEFLKYYGRDLDGYPNHFFDTVEICPGGQVGGDLRLTGSRLRIGMKTGLGGWFRIFTSTELRDRWSDGSHLEGNAALSKLKGVRWGVVDPVGTSRTTIRKALRGFVAKLKTRLGGLDGKPEADVRAELSRLVREETSESAVDDQDRSIRERALAKVASMSAAQLARLAKDWSLEIDKGAVEGAEDATVTMTDVLKHKNVTVNVTQSGFVNVQNFKQISVDVAAFVPSGESFKRYVETVEEGTTIEVKQSGFVNVQLNDVVDVRVQIVYAKTAQTASLDRVLGP